MAVADAIKASKGMKNSLETTFEMTKLIQKWPKQDDKLKDIKIVIEQEQVSDVLEYRQDMLWRWSKRWYSWNHFSYYLYHTFLGMLLFIDY